MSNSFDRVERAMLEVLAEEGRIYTLPLWRKTAEKLGGDIDRIFCRNTPSLGTIYVAVENFEKRELVTTERGDPTPERSNREKLFVEITDKGRQALAEGENK